MYESLGRWGGKKRPTDAHAREVPAEFHRGTRWDFLRRHGCESAVAARGTRQERAAFAACLFRRTADPRNVMLAIEHLESRGGAAPGPNGLRLGDLGSGERWEMARALGDAIRAGTYRPGPHREVQIPKGPGRGLRTLRIQDVEDRVVQRAIVQVVQPLIDPSFVATSFGYRPGRDWTRYHALAHAEALARSRDRWTWVTEDIRDAFEQPPHKRLLDVVRLHLPDDAMMGLIGAVIENEAGRGLRQGGSLSPLLLNVFLDHLLDKPWARLHPDVPLIRVADDVLIPCRDPREALEARKGLEGLLRPAGMPLKGSPETTIRDLDAGQVATWLGLDLTRRGDELIASMTDASWAKLDDHLAGTHDKPGAPLHASETILGWIDSMGMCFRDDDLLGEVHARVATIAHRYAFDEIPPPQEFRDRWQRAHARWLDIRTKTAGRRDGEDAGGSARRIGPQAISPEVGGGPAPHQVAGWVRGRMPDRDEARTIPPWQELPDRCDPAEGRMTPAVVVSEPEESEDCVVLIPIRHRRRRAASRRPCLTGRSPRPAVGRTRARGGAQSKKVGRRIAITIPSSSEGDSRWSLPRPPPALL